jgi:hypothetical protein
MLLTGAPQQFVNHVYALTWMFEDDQEAVLL